MEWFFAALKKYAVFRGRARRKEFWYFVLFYFLILMGLSIMEGSFGVHGRGEGGTLTRTFTLAMLIPSLSLNVRRLHDINRSGRWVLISLAPIIGILVLGFFALQDSQPGNNRFGPNPKAQHDAVPDICR